MLKTKRVAPAKAITTHLKAKYKAFKVRLTARKVFVSYREVLGAIS